MRVSHWLAAPLLALLSLTGCDPDSAAPTPSTTSVFIINEGSFTHSNGSVSVFDKATKAVTNADIFRSANGRGLGDVVQSMAVQGSKGYLVVNNSNKVEVVNLPSFTSVATIRKMSFPRYCLPVSATKGYLTQWGDYSGSASKIKVIDLNTNLVVDSIATGTQPERLALVGGKVYVANSGSNTVTVIDPTTNAVVKTLPVGDGPNSFAVDKNGALWVLCGGKVAYTPTYAVDYTATTPGQLVRVDAGAATVASSRTFATNRLQPTDLHLNQAGDQLLFRAADATTYLGAVCRLGIGDANLPVLTAPFIRRAFYGLNVDPQTDVIYGGTGTFGGADKLIRYQSNGTALDSVAVGVGPNGFVFY